MPGDPESARGGVTARIYLNILQEGLPTIMDADTIFMQDNAPIHGEKTVKRWLSDMAFTVMDWPPYSPDLNPIEHLWFPLKENVHRLHPELISMKGAPDTIKDVLARACIEGWEAINEELL